MKKLMILTTALLFITGLAMAQQPGDSTRKHGFAGHGMAQKGTHRNMAFQHKRGGFGMHPMVRLTDAQKQQMKTVNEDYHNQLAALQANDKLSLGDYKSQLAALHKKHEAAVQGVYTDEQKQKIAEFKKQRDINMQVRATDHLERMKLELGLSDGQVAKLKTQQEQLHTQVKALRENTDLLPEQKREQLKTLFAQQKDQFKSVLTPDQATKLEGTQKHRFHRGGGWQGKQA